MPLNVDNNYCPTCRAYLWAAGGKNHKCAPLWSCRFDNKWKDDVDWRDVYARTAEDAAEKFAEDVDCENEYSILTQGDRCNEIIEVRGKNGGVVRFSIRAESVPHYYAEQIDG